jgi:hypothetical protein
MITLAKPSAEDCELLHMVIARDSTWLIPTGLASR